MRFAISRKQYYIHIGEFVCVFARNFFFGTPSAWSCTSITYMRLRFSNRRYIREKRQKGGAILTNDVGLRSRCNVVCVWQRDWQHGCVWPRRRCVWILFSIIYILPRVTFFPVLSKQVFCKSKGVTRAAEGNIYIYVDREKTRMTTHKIRKNLR